MDTKGKGLLYEMKNGYPITMSEEEYKAKENVKSHSDCKSN